MGIRQKIQALQILLHAAALIYVLSAGFDLWKFLIFSIPSYFLVSRIGNDIGFHRLFCHRSFKAGPVTEFILLTLGSLDLKGSSIGWSALHLTHHKHSDTEKDPHGGSGLKKMLQNWFLFYDLSDTKAVRELPHLIGSPVHRFFHAHYFKIILSIYLVLLATLPFEIFFYLVILPAVWSYHASAAINVICHNYGYRVFNSPDQSYNNMWVHLLTLGGGLHNSHHEAPKKYHLMSRWYEVDINGILILSYLRLGKIFSK